jgi:N-acetyl-gamma-glutamyl-phosphate reductase
LFAIWGPPGLRDDSTEGVPGQDRIIDKELLQLYALCVHRIPVGVLGASGYAGQELCALITRHPSMELAFAAANERAGECMRVAGRSVYLEPLADLALERAALVFSALPHGVSAPWAARARAAGAKVVDLSADFRPGNPAATPEVPYGLTELARERVRAAAIVANPGCYPTAILLALAPLARAGLIAAGTTIGATAASGTTGAGRAARADLLFSEVSEDYRAYGVGNEHRHVPEMRAVLDELGSDGDIVFTPHLLPVARGILATITVPIARPIDDPLSLWRDAYAGEPFIEVTPHAPTLRDVARRNVVRISAVGAAGTRMPTLIVLAAIDNLVKGAAGQALQNANLMLGLAEGEGLPC